jgi:ubiquinone/menaquinone biosynthesis C-methylase UbiE
LDRRAFELLRQLEAGVATIAPMAGVSFDRAAEYYDATRGLPDEVVKEVADVLRSELAGTRLCLEIGVGTGRIALPLARREIQMIGADLAPAMLSRLVANAGGNPIFPLMTADVTALPLRDASIDAVLGCHVLHLIPNWQTAVDEACRVLRPGGLLLMDFGGPTPTPWTEDCIEILGRHGVFRRRPGVSNPDPVTDYLGPRARRRALRPLKFTIESSLGDDLKEWEDQILAWTWPYTSLQMRSACEEIRAVASSRGWTVDRKVRLEAVIQWWAFDYSG